VGAPDCAISRKTTRGQLTWLWCANMHNRQPDCKGWASARCRPNDEDYRCLPTRFSRKPSGRSSPLATIRRDCCGMSDQVIGASQWLGG